MIALTKLIKIINPYSKASMDKQKKNEKKLVVTKANVVRKLTGLELKEDACQMWGASWLPHKRKKIHGKNL